MYTKGDSKSRRKCLVAHHVNARWASRLFAYRNLMDRLLVAVWVLTEVSKDDNPARAVEARAIVCQIDINFITLLSVFRNGSQ